MDKQETILFAPLNWGLGHATRLVPLINDAILKGHNVLLAGEGSALNFLRLEFPTTRAIEFKGYRVRYAPKPLFLVFLLLQMPLFYATIWIENLRLSKLIKSYKITKVVSDNRYGLWNKNIESILITHQVFMQLPRAIKFLEPLVHLITRWLITPFTVCYIPDYELEEKSLAGRLSHSKILPRNARYIGPLSRFKNFNSSSVSKELKTYDILVLVSGPEPQRSYFECEMEERFTNTGKYVLMVCGKPQKSISENVLKNNITKVEHLNTPELYYHLSHSKHIVARSGYSTLMDLHVLGLSAELIPTAGQSEQEYLALWWKNKLH